jgi:serine/threonine-protein kinase HipA
VIDLICGGRFPAPTEDLHQHWRRIVFSVLISNTDDQLRPQSFLYEGNQGWRLSPAYDLNPVPAQFRPRILSTLIDEQSTEILNEFPCDSG